MYIVQPILAPRGQATSRGAGDLKKPCAFCQRVTLQSAFIAENQPAWPVAVLCEVLGGRRRGLYAYYKRQVAPKLSREEIGLLERIKAISAKTDHGDGSRHMAKHLMGMGWRRTGWSAPAM